jgi:Meiotically up-regulated gene 113
MVGAVRHLLHREVRDMATVYFLRSGNEDLFKIGITRGDVEARRKNLSTGNPHGLVEFARVETPNASATETFAHRWIETRRCSGDAREFFALTAEEAAEHVRLTEDFATNTLPRREKVAELAELQSDERALVPGEEAAATYQELVEVREQIYRLSIREEQLKDRLRLFMGDAGEIAGLVTWKTEVKNVFMTRAFKSEHDVLYRQFLRQCKSRKFNIL